MALTKITNSLVAINAIQGTLIADNAITAVHIVNNAITATQLADNAVTATKIQNGIIATDHLAADLITAAKIADDAISEEHLDSTVISSLSTVTANSSDYLMLGDTSDSNNLKKALVSDISTDISGKLNLSGGTMTGDIAHAGDFTLDIGGDLSLDAGGDQIRFKDSGTEIGNIDMGSSNLDIKALVSDKDIIFRGNDGGSTVTALTLDMSEGGAATFAGTISGTGTITAASGKFATERGSAAAPTFTFSDDTDTGMYNVSNADLGFTVGGTERMRIDSNGDVGIGGAPGTAPLSVYSDGGAACLRLIGRDNGTSDESCISFFDNSNSTETCLILNVGTNLAFHTNGSEKMRLTSGGYLGLGTTAPTALLETYKSANYTKHWRIHRPGSAEFGIGIVGTLLHISSGSSMPASSNLGIFMGFNTGTVGIGKENASGEQLEVHQTTNDTSILGLEHAGSASNQYGIHVRLNGNPNDSTRYFLQCVGGASGSDTVHANIYSNGNITNTNNSYGSTSDVSIKENIVDATNKLDELKQVKVRNFNLIGESNKQIGMVAQELESIFPSLVFEDEETEKKSIKYSVFVPILIKAIQELEARLEALEE